MRRQPSLFFACKGRVHCRHHCGLAGNTAARFMHCKWCVKKQPVFSAGPAPRDLRFNLRLLRSNGCQAMLRNFRDNNRDADDYE